VSSEPAPQRLLTPSERTLLVLLGNGRTISELARELGKARHTLKTHRSNAYRKLGAHTIGEAVELALDLGEIQPDDIVMASPQLVVRMFRAAEQQLAAVRAYADRLANEPAIAADLRAILNAPSNPATGARR
jgi:DNA-binding CsgD family transcriptional regulator